MRLFGWFRISRRILPGVSIGVTASQRFSYRSAEYRLAQMQRHRRRRAIVLGIFFAAILFALFIGSLHA